MQATLDVIRLMRTPQIKTAMQVITQSSPDSVKQMLLDCLCEVYAERQLDQESSVEILNIVGIV